MADSTSTSERAASITRLLSLMRCDSCAGFRFDDPRFTPTCRCSLASRYPRKGE